MRQLPSLGSPTPIGARSIFDSRSAPAASKRLNMVRGGGPADRQKGGLGWQQVPEVRHRTDIPIY
jgi:hypothetical protein